jgi:hypothetical protein
VEWSGLTGVVVVEERVKACTVDVEVLGVDHTETPAESAVA